MTTNHTPTPWKLEHDPRWVWANIQRSNAVKPDVAKGLSPDDAAHIVACVNAHDALTARVAELEQALRLAQNAMRAPIDDWKGELERKALDAARAALAKGQA